MHNAIRLWFRVGLVAMAAAAPLSSQAVPTASLTRGTLAFDAKATLGAFTGTTSTVRGELSGSAVLRGARGWVEAPSRSLVTGNGKRDRDMYSSLEVDKYPSLRFQLDSVSPDQPHGDSTAVWLQGHLTLHGQTRAVAIPGWAWIRASGARFRGALPVNVKDYRVGGLSKALGMLKMQERIVIRIDVTFGG